MMKIIAVKKMMSRKTSAVAELSMLMLVLVMCSNRKGVGSGVKPMGTRV
jgi:hypothetical protein